MNHRGTIDRISCQTLKNRKEKDDELPISSRTLGLAEVSLFTSPYQEVPSTCANNISLTILPTLLTEYTSSLKSRDVFNFIEESEASFN